MLAAIYARKSTEQAGVSDEEKSVTRQVEHAKAYAAKKGWTVAEEHVYVDDGISGAEFIKRPGFLRLMNAVKPHSSFQVLIMSEESRLGRESIETAYALKQIMDAGVRVHFYLDDRERTLDTPLDKMMLALNNFASEMEREKARQRTYDAMLRKAKAKQVTGGKVFGYDNQDVPAPDGRRLHVIRVVNQDEARIVRRIFELYAAGRGCSRIAKVLNGEAIPPPRGGTSGWAPSAVREMLHRRLYKGEIVWNETQKIVRGGTKQRRRRPKEDWINIDAPELMIIPADLWQSVQKRLEDSRNTYIRSNQEGTKGRLLGRPAVRDVDSPYLLSGFTRCAHCGGPIESIGQDYSRKKGRFYGCAYHRKRGVTICSNSLRVQQDVLDEAILKAISDALDERILEAAVEKALEQLRSGQENRWDRRTAIERELSLIEGHERNLVDAIANGQPSQPLLVKLSTEEDRKKALIEELDQMIRSKPIAELDRARMKRDLRERVADAQSLLRRHVSQARQILKKLIEKPLICEAFEEGGRRGYRVTGQGSYLKLLPASVASPCVVSPTGFEPVLRP